MKELELFSVLLVDKERKEKYVNIAAVDFEEALGKARAIPGTAMIKHMNLLAQKVVV